MLKAMPVKARGRYLRVTGALVLDCGHATDWGLDHPCYDDDPEGDSDEIDDISSHSNQEIHPVYSIDIINFPIDPKTSTHQAQPISQALTAGVTAALTTCDKPASTNIHQLGHTIWWLGLMRDRQPMQRGHELSNHRQQTT